MSLYDDTQRNLLMGELFGDYQFADSAREERVQKNTDEMNNFFEKLELDADLGKTAGERMTELVKKEFVHGLDSYSVSEQDARTLDNQRNWDNQPELRNPGELLEFLKAERRQLERGSITSMGEMRRSLSGVLRKFASAMGR